MPPQMSTSLCSSAICPKLTKAQGDAHRSRRVIRDGIHGGGEGFVDPRFLTRILPHQDFAGRPAPAA